MFGKLCGAKARTNSYQPCRQPAVANGKCRLHGGRSSGPKSEEGKRRVKAANTKHGFYSIESENERRLTRSIINRSRESCIAS
jgi:hypothetical protein